MTDREITRHRYDPRGSLSEYGISPECDAQPLDAVQRPAEDAELEKLRRELDEWKIVATAHGEAKARAEQLAEALKKVSQSLDWYAHGRCRGFDDGPPLPTNEALELAKRTLAKVRA